MNQTDQETIATLALLAALADGTQTPEESAQLAEVFKRLGMTQLDEQARRASTGKIDLQELAARLSGEDARKMAYDTALAVIHSDGAANPPEMDFINQLRGALGLSLSSVRESDQQATALAGAGTNLPDVQVNTGNPPSDAVLDDLILKQAMLTGALEILPDRLANVAILPLQLRLEQVDLVRARPARGAEPEAELDPGAVLAGVPQEPEREAAVAGNCSLGHQTASSSTSTHSARIGLNTSSSKVSSSASD